MSDARPLRTRIGIICPDDGVNDDEYWSYLPEGVSLLWTRYTTAKRLNPISVDMVGSYGDPSIIADAAQTLSMTRPNTVAFCCNSCSFVHGFAVDEKIRQTIQRVTHAPATSVTFAQIEGLKALKARRVALAGPYRPEVTQKLQQLLELQGFVVTSTFSLGLETEWEIGNSPPSRWYDLACRVNTPDADAIVLACSGIRTREIMGPLERELGKPLVSAPAVTVWHSLRLAGVRTPVVNGGTLLEKF